MNFLALAQTAPLVELPGGPRRSLGQNFMVSDAALAEIVALADPREEEVVLEVGGGGGALSVRLAERVAHLHVVEVDRRLERALTAALSPLPNVSLHWADALKLDLKTLDPAPTKLVANLPYRIAATLILRLALTYPPLQAFTVLVQREVGERFV